MDGEREADAVPVPAPGSVTGGDDGGLDDRRSLVDDIEDLLVNACTWLDAEFTYQKTRAGFVASSLKSALVLVIVAGVLALVALIGLTVGLIIALAPLITAFGATALVVVVMLLICALLIRTAGRRWRDMVAVIKEDEDLS